MARPRLEAEGTWRGWAEAVERVAAYRRAHHVSLEVAVGLAGHPLRTFRRWRERYTVVYGFDPVNTAGLRQQLPPAET